MQNVTKGPGDLPGDNSNPNSPGYVEPAFDLSDADVETASKMVRDGEVAALVGEVREARALLDWIARCTEVPSDLLSDFRALDRRATEFSKSADAFLAVRS